MYKKTTILIPQAGMYLYSEVHLSINICKSFLFPKKRTSQSPTEVRIFISSVFSGSWKLYY